MGSDRGGFWVPRESAFFDKFRRGERFLWGKFLGAVCHLGVLILVVAVAAVRPEASSLNQSPLREIDPESLRARQALLEALDYYVRYQQYYREVYGRFSRDLAELGVPDMLALGSLEEVRRNYEISVLEASSKRLVILATAQPGAAVAPGTRSDRITVDERFRLNANFQLPPLAKKYLLTEADRGLSLRFKGREALLGLSADYWSFEPKQEAEKIRWSAVGKQGPVLGNLRHHANPSLPERGLASVFTRVSRHLGGTKRSIAANEEHAELGVRQIRYLLADARLAQHIHLRERGFYAEDWQALDQVTSFRIVERLDRSPNLSREPIELLRNSSFELRLKAISGPLLGEVFSMGLSGELKQIRFTDVLVKKLNESSKILQGTAVGFQISEIKDRSPSAEGHLTDQDSEIEVNPNK